MTNKEFNTLLNNAMLFIQNELSTKVDLNYREWDQLISIRKAGQKKVIGYLSGNCFNNFEINLIN